MMMLITLCPKKLKPRKETCWFVVGMSQYLQDIKQVDIKNSESEEHKGSQKIRYLLFSGAHVIICLLLCNN